MNEMTTIVYVIIALTCAVAAVSFVTLVVVLHNLSKSKQKVTQNADASSEENNATTTEDNAESADENKDVDDEVCESVCADSEQESPQDLQEADVAFSTDKLTLEQKYLKLPSDKRAYYDEIVRYAMAVDGNKRYKSAVYEEYKVGKSRIVRMKIKNDVITCELIVPNLDLKNYVSDNKIEIRQAPTIIRVDDQESLEAVKGCMDVALKQIEKERQYKKEQALLRRRQQRVAKKNAQANDSEN